VSHISKHRVEDPKVNLSSSSSSLSPSFSRLCLTRVLQEVVNEGDTVWVKVVSVEVSREERRRKKEMERDERL
jgi:hypothetical protein